MSMSCGLCLKSITEQAAAIQTGAKCKHYFHDSCVKIRCGLPSKARAAVKIATTCPVCFVDVSGVLSNINAKLDKIDGIESKISTVTESMTKLVDQVDKLMKNYDSLSQDVRSLATRVEAVEKRGKVVDVDKRLLEEVKGAAKTISDGQLELRTLQLETQLLADEIMVGGLPESTNEKLDDIVVALMDKLMVPASVDDIVKVERLGAKIRNKDCSIRVKFNNQKLVNSIMKNIKGNEIKVGDLSPMAQSADACIFIHHRHPSSLYKFRQEVRKKYPNIMPRNIWISYATVNLVSAPSISLHTTINTVNVLPNYCLNNCLKICHFNAQSLRNEQHFELFREYFRCHQYDIIAVSETWLNHLISDNLILLPSYTLYRHDRRLRSGGGVALYVRNELHSKYVASSLNTQDKHPEYLFIEVSASSREKLLIGVVYKPPNTGHLEDLEEELEAIIPSFNIIMMGDFNSDLGKDCFFGDQLRRLCSCHDLHIVEYQSTHHLQDSDSWIDACIVDDLDKVLHSEQSKEPFISNHDLISITYNYRVEFRKFQSFSYRNWNRVDDRRLQDLCISADTDLNVAYDTVDDMNHFLHELLDSIINDIAPEKTINPRRPPATWFTPEIKDLQNRRDRLYRIFRRTGYAYKEYSNVRRLVKQRLTKEKKRYFDQQLSSAKNSRALWSDLRRLGLIKRKNAHQELRIDLDELNDYFIDSVNIVSGSEVTTNDIILNSDSNNNDRFYFQELSMESVKKSIMRILSSSVGPDNFSIKAYKCVLPYLLHWFTKLFNMSLVTGIGRIVDWCKLNCLRLNASKTKSIIIGSRIKVSSDVCLSAENIVVAGSVIPYVKTVKYLGVVIDNTLSWEHQVTKMCNQAMSSLAQLKISNEVFNRQLRIKLVTTIIFPIFDYCCAAFTNMSKKLQMRLQKNELLFGSKLQFLEVAMRRGDIRQDYLRLPMSASNIYDKSFLIQGIRVWNSLPAGLTTVDDLTEFQNRLFVFLLDKDV
ncbi:Protein of unknown function [Cotesia congregata]|uniref:RING-type domain-containing protein n=1 Tax=Cotesia congregata TaxID=51543 RepID=A0A8J2MDV2_COTCN|nr:Protein of unknown function [Cotesia congregata]